MKRAILQVVVMVAMIGCSASPDSVDAAAETCAAFARSVCAHTMACDHFGFRVRYSGTADCEDDARAPCLDELAAEGTASTIDTVKQCAAAYERASCAESAGRPLPACAPKPGRGAAGAPCMYASQCSTSLCVATADNACGVCTVPIAEGAACAIDRPCADGLGCARGACVALASAGAPCGASVFCASMLTCSKGLCTPYKSEGDSCDGAPFVCNPLGLYCTADTKKCAPVSFADPGQACGTTATATIDCAARGVCAPVGTCIGPVGAGVACNVGTGPPCAGSLRCVGGTCGPITAASCR